MCKPSTPDAPPPPPKMPEAPTMPDAQLSEQRRQDLQYRRSRNRSGTLLTGDSGLSTPSTLGSGTLLSGLNG